MGVPQQPCSFPESLCGFNRLLSRWQHDYLDIPAFHRVIERQRGRFVPAVGFDDLLPG